MALWNPSNAATPVALWLKADAITGKSDGDGVTTWSDSSGSGANASSGGYTAPLYKTGQINGLPVVRVSGTLGAAMRSYPAAAANYELFAFARMNGGANARLIGAVLANNNWLMGWWSGVENVMYAVGWVAGPTGVTATTNWHSYSGYFDGTNTTFNDYGNLIASDASGTSSPNGGIALGGYDPTGTQELSNGDIAEVILYNSNLSSADRHRVEGYMAWKYGQQSSLPSGHAYVSAAPTIGSVTGLSSVTGLASIQM